MQPLPEVNMHPEKNVLSYPTSQHLQAGPSMVQESTSARKPALGYLIHSPNFYSYFLPQIPLSLASSKSWMSVVPYLLRRQAPRICHIYSQNLQHCGISCTMCKKCPLLSHWPLSIYRGPAARQLTRARRPITYHG